MLREALRQRVIVACALGDAPAARKAYDIWIDKGGEPFAARREALRRLLERCTGVPAVAAKQRRSGLELRIFEVLSKSIDSLAQGVDRTALDHLDGDSTC